MEPDCPVCQGMSQLSEACPACGAPMEDCGSIDSYWDPYGPYEARTEELTATGTRQKHCVHLLQCPNCEESLTRAVHQDTL